MDDFNVSYTIYDYDIDEQNKILTIKTERNYNNLLNVLYFCLIIFGMWTGNMIINWIINKISEIQINQHESGD
ncbi:hypothetical protein A2331_05950 [Candidatus Falkowbacteria bacterium RIFOXYB2_FULL_34_18]|uniref:Uncharacterized protein n=1 Tax=Candidatus Falkowbacteria bacterium RIFOXYD2_FULL_34_120 TaxID=1798007 RepID=A0A1F5TPN7_9BACT|nr:MAG: hypothetical protein A2331_05950 [Candidatus Falkowbacteria bacterium RIFOXYB2_FULL_34_18]OGF29069.1 MAG: hypothetical protein A2500_03445 [Candidatus Falkowbacteria bacterium RIFOXYC12_FULL_34_55]OGF36121.1 MAG: hypothetical protein A2466_03525 [Candidatus Falkowbacteria bacterium RIFOXYC2_FULL_34_220]OGF38573.1 MAG: hypothetical protein A2515_04785 [Candidatus Falkowbacteria bacterium RIFOXYD12_FULL_34_57]OGF40754.1 MAG: hypothetical protein A2531_06970 [Candidatus Falkowbacteria bact